MEAVGIYLLCGLLVLGVVPVTCSGGIRIACSGALDKHYSVTLLLDFCCPVFLEGSCMCKQLELEMCEAQVAS